ncbi:MAG: SO_0444 family Cu/Zn efflux transporter [Calditrichaeota bacterium]|nr:SO_0444 family Cu/Zn efflux transporter [Calditrichota bacterium]
MSEFITEFWSISKEAAPYLLLGFLLAGIIKVFLKDSFIQKHLGSDSKSSVLKAAFFGIPLPLCSCGVVPTAISLNKQGASKGATTSFLVSTPESGVDSIAITYALMDPIMTVVRPVAAFISAVFTGLFETRFHHNEQPQYEPIPQCCSTDIKADHAHDHQERKENTSVLSQLKSGLRYSFVDLMSDISLHLLIGLILAAGITFFLPDDFFASYLTNDYLSMLAMLVIGVPMYICAAASTPIAAALILKGLSPGAALVFLMAGPATNIASLTVLQKSLGKATIGRYLGSIIVLSFVFGILTNFVYTWLNVTPTAMVMTHEHGALNWLGVVSAIILFGMIAYGIWNENLKAKFISAQTAHAK